MQVKKDTRIKGYKDTRIQGQGYKDTRIRIQEHKDTRIQRYKG